MTTRTTFHLSLSRGALAAARARAWLLQYDPIAVMGIGVIVLIIAGASIRSALPSPSHGATAQPTTPQPIIMIATAQAHSLPTADATKAATQGHTLARAVVAYDSPNGTVIGAIDSGRAYTAIERAGADWLHADVSGSGVVWLRTAEVFDLPDDLADVQPTAAPVVVAVPSAPQPQYQAANAPRLPPADPDPIVVSDAERTTALAAHNAQQAGWCAAGGAVEQPEYCAMVQGAVAP